MQRYRNENSGIVAYEIGNDYIKVQFTDGKIYLYNYITPGKEDVDMMKRLAEAGEGLTTYINRYVRDTHAGRIV